VRLLLRSHFLSSYAHAHVSVYTCLFWLVFAAIVGGVPIRTSKYLVLLHVLHAFLPLAAWFCAIPSRNCSRVMYPTAFNLVLARFRAVVAPFYHGGLVCMLRYVESRAFPRRVTENSLVLPVFPPNV
jgi:hypothetical protein